MTVKPGATEPLKPGDVVYYGNRNFAGNPRALAVVISKVLEDSQLHHTSGHWWIRYADSRYDCLAPRWRLTKVSDEVAARFHAMLALGIAQ